MKKAREGLRKKPVLVAQNYWDLGASRIATKAPTVQRETQRFLLALVLSNQHMTVYSRDVTQAYIQSDKTLERPFYIRAPVEMYLPAATLVRVLRPLYYIPESCLCLYITYRQYHIYRMCMEKTTVDPCMLLLTGRNQTLEGRIVLKVDDSLELANSQFQRE